MHTGVRIYRFVLSTFLWYINFFSHVSYFIKLHCTKFHVMQFFWYVASCHTLGWTTAPCLAWWRCEDPERGVHRCEWPCSKREATDTAGREGREGKFAAESGTFGLQEWRKQDSPSLGSHAWTHGVSSQINLLHRRFVIIIIIHYGIDTSACCTYYQWIMLWLTCCF